MANYDPKRTRPIAAPSEDEPAPIDALLDSIEVPTVPDVVEAPDVVGAPAIADDASLVDLRDDAPSGAPAEPGAPVEPQTPRLAVATSPIEPLPGPDRTTQRLAVVAGIAAAVSAVVLLWLRQRRRR